MKSDFTAVQAELRKHRQDYRAEKQQVAPRPDQAPPTPAALRTLVGTLRQARVAADNFEHGVALLFLLLLFLAVGRALGAPARAASFQPRSDDNSRT